MGRRVGRWGYRLPETTGCGLGICTPACDVPVGTWAEANAYISYGDLAFGGVLPPVRISRLAVPSLFTRSVMTTRGMYCDSLSNLRINSFATLVLRRLCTRMSST